MNSSRSDFTHHNQTQQQDAGGQAAAAIPRHDCDILLNNFLVKKRRFRVLLNYNHIVWEALERGRRSSDSSNNQQKSQKDSATETDKLPRGITYGAASNIVHITDVITVTKRDSKTSSRDSCSVPSAKILTIHYALRVIKSSTDCNRWRVRCINFYNSDAHVVQQWYTALRQKLTSQWRVQRLLVFINPYGGSQNGLKIYECHCKPLFQLAGIDASCIISQRANQIRDILMNHDLSPFDAVCCVGGDGTVAEVINGLLFRGMRDCGMDAFRSADVPKPALPMGIIPAGSTDTVAYSLHGTADVQTAAVHLVLGQRRGLDICSVHNNQGILRFCASVLSYGYLGDVAARSEKYRWMGTKRYEYTGVKAFLKNRGYEAEIRLMLPKVANVQKQPTTSGDEIDESQVEDIPCHADCKHCNAKADCKRCNAAAATSVSVNHQQHPDDGKPTSNSPPRSRKPSNNSNHSDVVAANMFSSIYNHQSTVSDDAMGKSFRGSKNGNCDKGQVIDQQKLSVNFRKSEEQHKTEGDVVIDKCCDVNKPLNVMKNNINNNVTPTAEPSYNAYLNEPIVATEVGIENHNKEALVAKGEQWQVIKGSFFMISGANISCACSRSPNGISRFSHLGDGHLDLILVRKTSLLNNVRFVLNTLGRGGDIRNLPFVEVHRTREFCFRIPRAAEEQYSVRGSSQPITQTRDEGERDRDGVSCWNCDGEVVNELDITMKCHCQLIDVFMRGPYLYAKNDTSSSKYCFCCCGKAD